MRNAGYYKLQMTDDKLVDVQRSGRARFLGSLRAMGLRSAGVLFLHVVSQVAICHFCHEPLSLPKV